MNDFSNGAKIIFKFILKYYLKYITKLVLFIHRPLIIAVSGSINIVFTRDEIKRQLTEAGFEVRSNPKNFNTEIGLPLAILNLPSGYNSYKNWLPVTFSALKLIFKLKFPKILVLGLGVAEPGDMKYLMSLIKPKIGVITDLTQRYLESFEDVDELVREYKFFTQAITKDGYLILNADNPRLRNLAKGPSDRTIFFGLEKNQANLKNYWQGKLIEKTANGLKISLTQNGHVSEHEINRHGQHHIYARLCGLAVKQIVWQLS